MSNGLKRLQNHVDGTVTVRSRFKIERSTVKKFGLLKSFKRKSSSFPLYLSQKADSHVIWRIQFDQESEKKYLNRFFFKENHLINIFRKEIKKA
jgi:hypothetical protein